MNPFLAAFGLAGADLLIVDDDSDLSEALGNLLEGEGFRVRRARNGQHGLEIVRERRPDLILLDIEMPCLTGPEMAHRLFLNGGGEASIPIVLLSGVTTLAKIAATVGTPYYVAKPFNLRAVLRVVSKALLECRSPKMTGSVPM